MTILTLISTAAQVFAGIAQLEAALSIAFKVAPRKLSEVRRNSESDPRVCRSPADSLSSLP